MFFFLSFNKKNIPCGFGTCIAGVIKDRIVGYRKKRAAEGASIFKIDL